MKDLFLKFRDMAAAIPGMQLVDRDKGQLDRYEGGRPPVPFPCTLLKINITNAKNLTMSGDSQLCKARIELRVAFDPMMQDTASIAPDDLVQQSLEYYDLTEAVYNAFQGYTDDEVENLVNITQADEDRRDGYVVVKMVFETEFERYKLASCG